MTMDVPRGPNGRRRYAMDYIADKTLFKAVMFARRMIREGTPPGVAITRAAGYHAVPVSEVARYVGQAGGDGCAAPAATMTQMQPTLK